MARFEATYPEYHQRLARVPMRRNEIGIRGAVTAYWEYGPADAEQTLLLVHGFRGEHHGLEPVVAHLPGMRIISPDLPGFGQSPPIAGVRHDIDLYAAWLREFSERVAPGAVLVGHSFGSIVTSAAVASGLDTPRVVLINPIGAPALAGPRGVLTHVAVAYYRLGAALPARSGEALLRNRLIVRGMSLAMVKTRDPGLRRFVHAQHDAYFSSFSDRDVLADAFTASVTHDVTEYAAAIDRPTLLIAGERDDITPLAAQRRLATLISDARLVEIPRVGHLIHYETPQPAAEAIIRFLEPSASGTP